MLRVPLMAAIITAVLIVAGNGRSEEEMAAESDEASSWCVSNCGTCPMICSPPPKASINVVPSPSEKRPPPPPPPPTPPPPSSWSFSSSPYSSSSSSSPAGGQERGGFSYPYYYFYSSDALRARVLLPASMRFLLLLLALFSAV